MNPPLVFLCSPHLDGVTDRLGHAAAAGAKSAGVEPRLIRLCDYQIQPCRGCGACLASAGICALSPDAADDLFVSMHAAPALIFASPVYFYALPGQFKLFIDRSQKLWSGFAGAESGQRWAAVIMAAARKKGEKLFEGSLLTLKWFLKPFGFAIADTLLTRGLESVAELDQSNLERAFALGRSLASRL